MLPTSQVSVDYVSCVDTRFAIDRRLDVGIRLIPRFCIREIRVVRGKPKRAA
jgi:hypothetical protein